MRVCKGTALVSLLIAIVVGGSCFVVLSQPIQQWQSEESRKDATVILAVAPVYPSVAVDARLEGKIVVDVLIGSEGEIISAKASTGQLLLRANSELTARRWQFEPLKKSTAIRTAQLTFVYRIVSEDALPQELTPIFRPPYQVEVRHLPPRNVITP